MVFPLKNKVLGVVLVRSVAAGVVGRKELELIYKGMDTDLQHQPWRGSTCGHAPWGFCGRIGNTMAHGDEVANKEGGDEVANKKGGKRKRTGNMVKKHDTFTDGKKTRKTFRCGLGPILLAALIMLGIKPAEEDAADLAKFTEDLKGAEALAKFMDGLNVEESKDLQEKTALLEMFKNKMAQQDKLKEAGLWDFFSPLKEGKVSLRECWKSPKAVEYVIRKYEGGNFFKILDKLIELNPNLVAVNYGLKRKMVSAEEMIKYVPKIEKSLKTSDLYINYFNNNKEADNQENLDDGNKDNDDGSEDEDDGNEGQGDDNEDDGKISGDDNKKDSDDKKKKSDNNKHGNKLLKADILRGLKDVYGKKDKELEFLQLFLLLALCTLFVPLNAAQHIHYKYLNCVKSMEAIQTTSWPDFIFDYLMKHSLPSSVNVQCF